MAAWVHPNTVSGDQPIVLKRANNKTSFSLGIHKGNIEMSVVLSNGKTVISQAPITAGTWSHVAGLYDGTFVYLFINGQQFGQVYAGSALRDVFAPIRIGATTQSQHFDGIIDEVFVTMQPISKDALTALACISHPSTLAVNPPTSGPGPLRHDRSLHHLGERQRHRLLPAEPVRGLQQRRPRPRHHGELLPVLRLEREPGGDGDFGADVTGSDEADPGAHIDPVQSLFASARPSRCSPGSSRTCSRTRPGASCRPGTS